MPNEYFRLFANCIPVRGAKRSIICDLQRTSFKFIPNSLVDLLNELRTKCIEEVESSLECSEDRETLKDYLEFLTKNEFGFYCSKEELILFPDIDFKPSKTIEPLVTNAIIDVSPDSTHDYPRLLRELELLGCKHIQVRSYEQIGFVHSANHILSLAEGSRIQSIDFLAKYTTGVLEESLFPLTEKYSRLKEITVHSSPFKKIVKDGRGVSRLFYVEDAISSNQHCGIISPYYFAINVEAFGHAQNRNSCLHGKISIDEHGDIKNCPSMKVVFGNTRKNSLREALLSTHFKNHWNITKDQISICRDCEFRYICTDCRAFTLDTNTAYGKPSKCSYDPYTATWN